MVIIILGRCVVHKNRVNVYAISTIFMEAATFYGPRCEKT